MSSTVEALTAERGGGLPTPPRRTATITLTDRCGDQVTVSTWTTCIGVADFITAFLGEPGQRSTITATEVPSCSAT